MTEYVLKISTNKNYYSNITTILQVIPSNVEYFWELVIDENNKLYTKSIDYFMNLIESNMQKLEEIGIRSNDISIWFYKPYEEQCNMEFTPHEMNRLSKNGITLCISCWKTT